MNKKEIIARLLRGEKNTEINKIRSIKGMKPLSNQYYRILKKFATKLIIENKIPNYFEE